MMKSLKRKKNTLWLAALALCAALLLAGCGGAQEQGTSEADAARAESISETGAVPEAEETAPLPPVPETMTALEDARNYLEIMAVSRETLISQLVYDGFSAEEAEEAADGCGADWNEQAVRQAKSYLDTMEFTYEELVDQLQYDKFTPEQAVYGADNCGAAW